MIQGAGGLGHIGVQCLAALTTTRIVVVDRNPDALALAKEIGADETVQADGNHVEAVKDLTGGHGTDVVFDFVAEQGAENDGWATTAPVGFQFVIGYGGELRISTLDFVAGEKNVIGNIVGPYNDLAELMVLAQPGKVTLHTSSTRWTRRSTPCTTSTPAASAAGPSSSRSTEEPRMYERNGEKYFVVGSHSHLWDAGRGELEAGRAGVRQGWIDCFYGYHQLGPEHTRWDYEKYLKITPDDFERDVFVEGHVDKAIFLSMYLKEWYVNGFNTAEQNAQLLERFGDRLIVNGRFDPRDGGPALKQLEADARTYALKGEQLYTAEWNGSSRGYRLTDSETYEFLHKAQELGSKNVHVPQGPDDLPLDKDAFDVAVVVADDG